MSPRRQYLATLVLLAAAGALGLTAASRSWGTVRMPSSLSSVTATTVSGSDLVPLAPAVSLVAIAAIVAIPAVRGLGRRVIGVVVASLGGALVVMASLAVRDLEGRVASWATSSPGTPEAVDEVSTAPGWALLQVAAGLLVFVAGVLVLMKGPSWPGMGAKYERPAPGGDSGAEASTGGNRAVWDALDRGDDPT